MAEKASLAYVVLILKLYPRYDEGFYLFCHVDSSRATSPKEILLTSGIAELVYHAVSVDIMSFFIFLCFWFTILILRGSITFVATTTVLWGLVVIGMWRHRQEKFISMCEHGIQAFVTSELASRLPMNVTVAMARNASVLEIKLTLPPEWELPPPPPMYRTELSWFVLENYSFEGLDGWTVAALKRIRNQNNIGQALAPLVDLIHQRTGYTVRYEPPGPWWTCTQGEFVFEIQLE